MPLSDLEIIEWAKKGGISPFDESCVNPASIDLHIDHEWIDFEYKRNRTMLGNNDDFVILYPRTLRVELHNLLCRLIPDGWRLRKPTAILAVTYEKISLSSNIAGEVKLKTTPTRKGLGHPIADWVDPGYSGKLTLMFHAIKEIKLTYGDKICQLVLWPMNQAAYNPYAVHGHYMNQDKPTLAWDEQLR